ncbi:immunity 42 family protein [Chitinophaga sedimenti]|uniref:Imm42 family immunity protein n=1 Tax=Chitinophaga sedimenti TaxID=2033606 RepID=UPI0020064793|nr:Imm42 family immunity protein [Chitinophaga sedimenti]MCK7556237.1 immunity 42 family protein [Chitinophaga sedimenti]
MNFVGNKEIFALQWDVDSYHAPYLYGYFCFWVNNNKVGNLDEISTLTIVSSYLSDFLKNKNNRLYEGSELMAKEDLFHLLYLGFFDGSFKGIELYYRMSEYSNMFWLDEIGEYSFRDKIGMILIDEPVKQRQRMIWIEFGNNVVNEFFIPANYFDDVGSQFLDKIDSML